MEKLSMRKIREVLRLKFELDLSERQISKSTQVSRPTISDYLRRFAVSGLSWPLPAELADADIEKVKQSGCPFVANLHLVGGA